MGKSNKSRVGRFLAPLTLFEWGVILAYFYFSHRLAAFLHPSFRPMVVVTGFLLLIAATCVLVFGKEAIRDCEGEHCGHSHASLTPGGLLAFLILILPIALAAKLSPDGYGEVLIRNRGTAESLANLPAAMASGESHSEQVAYPGREVSPEQPRQLPKEQPSAIPEWRTASTPGFSAPKVVLAKVQNEQLAPEASSGGAGMVKPPSFAMTPKNKKDNPGLAVDVIDLLVAAHHPARMSELRGKRIELVGQLLPAEADKFRLVRLLIVCCAADAQPLAVRVDFKAKLDLPKMAWAKVTGTVAFIKAGDDTVPVITAERVSPIATPAEPYLYWKGACRTGSRYAR